MLTNLDTASGLMEMSDAVPDPRIAGMITYPMDEMLLAVLVGVPCGVEDFYDVKCIGFELVDCLFGCLSKPTARVQILRRVFRVVDGTRSWNAF